MKIKTAQKTSTAKVAKPNRVESYDPSVRLFSHEHQGRIWNAWAETHLPKDLYKMFGLLDAKGSESWINVVEHNVFVAGAAYTFGKHIRASRTKVDSKRLVKAAIVHDLTKRYDIENDISREAETEETALAHALLNAGYDHMTMQAAFNTGRIADRYITDAAERLHSIKSKSLEANIVGYVDARTRGNHMYSLKQSYKDNLASKHRPEDKEFFTKYWLPYYTAVEQYLGGILEDFDPTKLNDSAIYRTVLHDVQAQSDWNT